MSTMLRSFVRLDHVNQHSICGNGESIKEAVNSIAYCRDGNTLSIWELVEDCERLNIDLEVVVYEENHGEHQYIVRAGDLPKIRAE